jgi:cytosine/adenosine deaminase-related metal-dependent hydrolase
MRTVIEGGTVVTVDGAGSEHRPGHLIIEDDRIAVVGPGPAPRPDTAEEDLRRIDARGCLVTPGLINTHHHLYQWATRGLATDATLFEWLTTLYPVWARLDEDATRAAATVGLGRLALTGCTTSTDHHYVFPRGGGDLFGATVEAAREVGLRFQPCRGSMDRGRSAGGLPPDEVVEETDAALAATQDAIRRFHDPAPGAMVRVAVAPCSPFSVSPELLAGAASVAREAGVRLHTHLAETLDEEEHCLAEFGCTPVEYLDRLGWLGPDTWLAHTVHLSGAAIKRLAATGTGVAHCPSSNGRLGAGVSPVRELLDAGVAVGLGVDGPASNEDGGLATELRQAVLAARARPAPAGGPTALTVRRALRLATAGGASCLGRSDELGSLEPGKLADIAVWRIDGPAHAGIADPVAALVLASAPPLAALLVAGRPIVADGALLTTSLPDASRALVAASRRLLSEVPR